MRTQTARGVGGAEEEQNPGYPIPAAQQFGSLPLNLQFQIDKHMLKAETGFDLNVFRESIGLLAWSGHTHGPKKDPRPGQPWPASLLM